jgi:hypothetical protein
MTTQIRTWDELNEAMDALTETMASISRYEALVRFRELRRHAADIPAGRDGEEVKRALIDMMDWAIKFVTAEVGE